MGVRRHWKQSYFQSLTHKQNFAANKVAKLLTMCIKIELVTDVEIRFSFDGADHDLQISYTCLPKKTDPYSHREGEFVTVIDAIGTSEIEKQYSSALDSLQYLLDNRVR